jgi:hypothetical protein
MQQKHGRLIDSDELIKLLSQTQGLVKSITGDKNAVIETVIDLIKSMPAFNDSSV